MKRKCNILILLIVCLNAQSQGSDEQTEDSKFQDRWEADTLVFQDRKVGDAVIVALKERDEFWYADKDFNTQPVERKVRRSASISDQTWFQTVLWLIIIAGFATVVAWYLANNNIRLFRKKNVRRTLLETDGFENEDIFSINYDLQIQRAMQSGDFRLAVRLMYLRLLKILAERNQIKFEQDKTNLDYLAELRKSNYYNEFFRVTRQYEYVWYGKFFIEERGFREIESVFNLLENKIPGA